MLSLPGAFQGGFVIQLVNGWQVLNDFKGWGRNSVCSAVEVKVMLSHLSICSVLYTINSPFCHLLSSDVWPCFGWIQVHFWCHYIWCCLLELPSGYSHWIPSSIHLQSISLCWTLLLAALRICRLHRSVINHCSWSVLPSWVYLLGANRWDKSLGERKYGGKGASPYSWHKGMERPNTVWYQQCLRRCQRLHATTNSLRDPDFWFFSGFTPIARYAHKAVEVWVQSFPSPRWVTSQGWWAPPAWKYGCTGLQWAIVPMAGKPLTWHTVYSIVHISLNI